MQIDLIVDLQYGSTGKGLIAGYLAEKNEYRGVATCNMPNAGHTYIDSRGNKMIHKVLPNGIVSPKLNSVFIGPGAVINMSRLQFEIDEAQKYGYLDPEFVKIYIHQNCTILSEDHAQHEQRTLSSISSTMQGSMAATVNKMERNKSDAPIAKYVLGMGAYSDLIEVVDTTHWMWRVETASHILAEGSQGFSLGLNQRFWPYCTSRECTPHRMISDMGLPYDNVVVYGTLRTFPIRVGNTDDGYSGDVYNDQTELSWESLEQVPERTTVTQRVRRVFTFSIDQLIESMWHCRPDVLFLNFCNYMGDRELLELVDRIEKVAKVYETPIGYKGYGPAFEHVWDRHSGLDASEFSKKVAHSKN